MIYQILIFYAASLQNYVLSYPESGCHVTLKRQSVVVKQWQMLRGWHVNSALKGTFVEDFRVEKQHLFVPPRSGLYFATLHLQLDDNANDVTLQTNVSVSGHKNYVSTDHVRGFFKTVNVNWMLLIDEHSTLTVHFKSSADTVLTDNSHFSVQFVSSYLHAVGFVASPVKAKLVPSRSHQLMLNWVPHFNTANGFSETTARFTIPVDGFYLIGLNLQVTTRGSLEVRIKDNEQRCLYKFHFDDMSTKTITHSEVRHFLVKTIITLQVLTETGCSVWPDSQYSVMLLSTSKSDSTESLIKLKADEKVAKGGDRKILNWSVKSRDFFNGAFQVSTTGYYYVVLRLEIAAREKGKVGLQFSLDNSHPTRLAVEKRTADTVIISVNNVLFIKRKTSLLCRILGNIDVTLLKNSSLVFYKIPFEIYNLVYELGNKLPTSKDRLLALKKPSEGSDANIALSKDGRSLRIIEDGIYYIVLSCQRLSTNASLSVMHIKHHRKPTAITTCHGATCFLPMVLFLQTEESIGVSHHCSEDVCDKNIESLSLEIQYFNQKEESVGVSMQTKSQTLASEQPLSFEDVFKHDLFFAKNISSIKDQIIIFDSGIYLIAVNLNAQTSAEVGQGKLSVMLIRDGSILVEFYSIVNSAGKMFSAAISKIHQLNKNDTLQVQISTENGITSTIKCTMSVFMISHDHSKYFYVIGSKSKMLGSETKAITFKVTKDQESNTYLRYIYHFIVQKTFVSVISLTLQLQFRYTTKQGVEFKVFLTKKGQQSGSHLVATDALTSKPSTTTLQISGTLILYPNDIVDVKVVVSGGLRWKILEGSSVSFAIMQAGAEDITRADYFTNNADLRDDVKWQGEENNIATDGVYMITMNISEQLNKVNESNLMLRLDKTLTNIWQTVIRLSVRNQSNLQAELFEIKCAQCTFEVSVFAELKVGQNVTISAPGNQHSAQYRLSYLGNEPDELTNHVKDQDHVIVCTSQRSYEQIFEHRAKNQERVLLTVNLLATYDNSNRSRILLTTDGKLTDGLTLSRVDLGESKYIYQLSRSMFLRFNQVLQVSVQCFNQTQVQIGSGSRFDVYIESILMDPVNEGMPVFFNQPQPRYINTPGEVNITCQAHTDQGKTQYFWNKISLHSGRHYKNISNASTLHLAGKPADSANYFCTAISGEYESESSLTTVNLEDKDECEIMKNNASTHAPCHTWAECKNTIGSYVCTCNAGFYGNGFHCEDRNECEDKEICGENASCTNLNGTYACSCNEGFNYTDGTNCTDINECRNEEGLCERELSSPLANCVNNNGSYRCLCEKGYQRKRNTCLDIDECFLFPCHEFATCKNNIGSYKCTCDMGWLGNGTHCQDRNECEEPNGVECVGNASCVNSPGSYRCICDRGFKGDGEVKCTSLGCKPPRACSGEYLASWWYRTPYIDYHPKTNQPRGLFKDILQLVVSELCHNCSQILFESPVNGSALLERKVEANITDFAFPVYGSKEQLTFRGFPFIPLVEAPGVAFFVKKQKATSSPLVQSLTGSWPILVITLLLAALSGVVVWFLDTVQNPDEFPNSFLSGSWEGFWWAFITMTTVGYGDKAPRSFFARMFGIVWILIGLVIISTFTATITTVLTASSIGNEAKLYGTKVGALANSEEFRLGVKRNADVTGYKTVPDILKALKSEEIQGALLDTFIAGEFQLDLDGYKLQEILEHVFVYGVVLVRDAVKLEDIFRKYVERETSAIYATISKVVKPLKENKASKLHASGDTALFDSQSPVFYHMLLGGVAMLLCLVMSGFVWDVYWQKKRRQNKMKEISQPLRLGWGAGDVIEHQKGAFKCEVSDLKTQIRAFSTTWLERLEGMERQHDQQLTKVQKLLARTALPNKNNKFVDQKGNGNSISYF